MNLKISQKHDTGSKFGKKHDFSCPHLRINENNNNNGYNSWNKREKKKMNIAS